MQSISFQTPAAAGEPVASVLNLVEEVTPECSPDKVLVMMLAAPINPLDILTLQDKYVVKPQNRTGDQGLIPGYDGIGRIVAKGANVQDLSEGTNVILSRHGIGTWRTHLLVSPNDLLVVPESTCPCFGALLRMGVTPAYLLLETAGKHLKPGDWIIQNAASGVIAHFIAQFARMRGFHVISVIRTRPDLESEKLSLQSHGADMVIAEDQLGDDTVFTGKKIMLGLDAVYGRLAERMAERMSSHAHFCSYGFLSGLNEDAHIKVTPNLIWMRKVTFEGFRLSQVLGSLSRVEQQDLVTWFADLSLQGRLTMPLTHSVFWQGKAVQVQEVLREAVNTAAEDTLGAHKKIIHFQA